MKIIFFSYAILLACVISGGCASVGTSGGGKLTESEQAELVEFARYFLTKNDKFTTAQQKVVVRTQEPEIKIHYTGDKTGKIFIAWELKTKRLMAILQGKLLVEGKMRWQVKVFKKSNVIISKKASLLMNQPKKLFKKDFADLKKMK